MKKGNLIKLQEPCHGIALIENQIAVSGYGKIYIINRMGDLKKTIDVEKRDYIHSISAGKTHQLYYAQANSVVSDLKFVRLDGTFGSNFVEDKIRLVDVKTDEFENAYFLKHLESSLNFLSFEDKSLKTILTKNDGLHNPYGFAFNTDFSKLFISNYLSGEILIFACT